MTEDERKYYEKLKSNRDDFNFSELFFIDENDTVQPKEGVWFRLIGDIPMFESTMQKRADLEKSTINEIDNHPLNQIRTAKSADQLLDEMWAKTPFGDPNSLFFRDRKKKKTEKPILQIKLLKIPKTFNDKIEFQVITNLEEGTRIQVSLCDVDSIFSNKPDSKVDTVLMSGYNTISERSVFNFTLNNEMQKKAFNDYEFDSAECYLKISHSKIEDAFSKVFSVQKISIDDINAKKKESWTRKFILDLIKNANQGTLDKKRNCSMCCLNAFASNLRALYKDNSPKNIPTNDIMSTAVKSLNIRYHSLKVVIPPKYNTKRLTTKSFDITDKNEFLKNVKPNVEEKLLSLTLTGQVCVFAVGIAAEYHSTLVVVSKDKDFKIDIGTGEALVGTEKNPLFLFVEDIGGTRSFEKTELDNKINEFVRGAYEYYNGRKDIDGKYFNHSEKDTSIDTNIYQLFDATKIK